MSNYASTVIRVVTSADPSQRRNCTNARVFQFISEKLYPIPLTFSLQSTRPQTPVYITATYGVGALVATKQVDAGRSQSLTVFGQNILFELEVDPRFLDDEQTFDVMIGVGEGGAAPRAFRSVVSANTETIAPAGEWVVPVPAGAVDVVAIPPAGAALLINIDAAGKGFPLTPATAPFTLPLRLPLVGEQNVRVVNTLGVAAPRPTLIFGIE